MSTRLSSAEETTAWGEVLARELRAGDVIALCGTLGAGKTHATKGIARGLGSRAEVTSPTFTLVHEYRDARPAVFHFDFYRIEKAEELISLGWDDYLDEDGVVVVEWADRFPELLPEKTRWFWFEVLPEGGRSVREGGAPA
jgi:tRNA threonylcarbamoyladenosine biosynthesis protein TsaE